MSESPGRLFCFGLGYTGGALARRLLAGGWQVAGTSREPSALADLAAAGAQLHRFDRGQPLPQPALAALKAASHVLSTVPPDAEGDAVLDLHGEALRRLGQARWLGYLSTTNVYGDRGGDWVDEATPPAPTTARGRRRLAAERRWLELYRQAGRPVHIFRLAGIYGPGRSQLEALRQGRAQRIDKPGQVFSRIHLDDLIATLLASMARPDPGAIYNVADDLPAPPAEVVAFAAGLLGVDPPPLVPFDQAALSAMARSFYAESKRVGNQRLKAELGVQLRYPDYREGLRALHQAE